MSVVDIFISQLRTLQVFKAGRAWEQGGRAWEQGKVRVCGDFMAHRTTVATLGVKQ